MNQISPISIEATQRDSERQKLVSAMTALKAGDAEAWVKLFRDEYKWPIYLAWNGRPVVECTSIDSWRQMNEMPSEWIDSIVAYLKSEHFALGKQAYRQLCALPFVSVKTRRGSNKESYIDNYWAHADDTSGARGERVGVEYARHLFAIHPTGCDDDAIESILTALIRRGPDTKGRLNRTGKRAAELGFISVLAAIVARCHERAPQIVKGVFQSLDQEWETMRPFVEQEERERSERARKASLSRRKK